MLNGDPQQRGAVTPSNPATAPATTPYSSPGSRGRAGEGVGGALNPTAWPTATGVNPNGNGPAPSTAPTTDWTSDPIYQLVIGQQNLAIKQAQAAALTAESQALIAYGDPTLALAVTGDQNVATAAGANKASTLARLMAQNKQNVRDTNEAENKANLFYSSDRGFQLGLAQQAYLNNSADALSNVQGTLGSIGSNLLAQQQAAYQNETQAASEAYQRALQNPTGSPAAAGPTPAPTTSKTTSSTAPPVAKGTPAPKTATAPYATPITSNPTGGSANKRQGVFAIH